MSNLLSAIAMLAVFALAIGAVAIWRQGDRRKGVLMALCAAVIFGNVLIWQL
jgi:hypothetical protein